MPIYLPDVPVTFDLAMIPLTASESAWRSDEKTAAAATTGTPSDSTR